VQLGSLRLFASALGAAIAVIKISYIRTAPGRRDPAATSREPLFHARRRFMLSRHPLRQGVLAGIIGGTSIAVWFLVIDAVAGRPFFTPTVLGAALFDLVGGAFGGRSQFTNVALYTVVHYALFMAIGVAATYATNAAEVKPSKLTGFAALFVALELGILTLVAVLVRSPLFGPIAWWQFGIANVVAAWSMGMYIWRTHHPLPRWDWHAEYEQTHEKSV
jgi:hypothetical protein